MRPGAVRPSLVVVALGLAVTSIVPIRAYVLGLHDAGLHPAVILLLAIATLIAVASAVTPGAVPTVRWCLVGVAGSLAALLLFSALVAARGAPGPGPDALLTVLVAFWGVGWSPPLTAFTLAGVVATYRLGGPRWLRPAALIYLAWSLVGVALAVLATSPAPGSPFSDLPRLVDSPVLTTVASVMQGPWVLASLLSPVVVWWTVSRTSGPRRPRLIMLALASLTPVITLVFCLAVTYLAYVVGVISLTGGSIGLAIAFVLPFTVGCPLVTAAVAVAAPTAPSSRTLTTVLSVAVGAPVVIVAVAAAWSAAAATTGSSTVLVSIAALTLGAVMITIWRRVVRRLLRMSDPVRARVAAARRVPRWPAIPSLELERVVRAGLGDSTAVVHLRLADGRWVDAHGHEQPGSADGVTPPPVRVEPPGPDAEAALEECAELVERALLELTVRDQEAALTLARQRADEATAVERRRLERDLHDGVQGRLLALTLDLTVAQRTLPPGPAGPVITDAVAGLGQAIEDLRSLAQGRAPGLLEQHGLVAALTDFTARMPLPVTLDAVPVGLDLQTASVAYLVVCESVTNAVKHARASLVDVSFDLTERPGGEVRLLSITVRDDGIGGARPTHGGGLDGLGRRVRSAGGRLVIADRPPSGTVVEVTMPCAS